MRTSRQRITVQTLGTSLGSGRLARAVLRRLGVEVRGGAFDTHELALAVAPQSNRVASRLSTADAAMHVLRRVLREYGIETIEEQRGKTHTVHLRAAGDARRILSVDFGFDSIVLGADSPVAARLQVARQRGNGAPQFSVTSLSAEATPLLFLFVLISEKRVWLVRRDELRAILKERASSPGATSRASEHRRATGFALHDQRADALRIWMPASGGTGLDLVNRIADADGRFVRSEEAS